MVVVMSVGSSVGSWCFTLGALHYLVPELAADVASAAKSGSGTKLHRSITTIILLNSNGYNNMMFALTMLAYVICGKG